MMFMSRLGGTGNADHVIDTHHKIGHNDGLNG